jgi:putative flippase GtrA
MCRVSHVWQQFRLLRYLVVGGANTALAYLAYALGLWAGLPVPLASLVSLLFGIAVSFATQGRFVFGHLSSQAFVRYMLNWLAMYLLYVGVVLELNVVGINPYVGGLAATAVTTSLSFVILGRLVFRASPRGNQGVSTLAPASTATLAPRPNEAEPALSAQQSPARHNCCRECP